MFFVYIFAATLCLSFLEAVPAPGHGALKGYCITNDHCLSNECCVSFEKRRGKRDTLSNDLKRFVDGKCESLGGYSSSCLVSNNSPQKIYYDSCPCGKYLRCNGIGIFDVPSGELGECRYSLKG